MIEKTRRRANSKGRTLDLIRSSGPISRVELAELTGLTQATISTVVRELLADGVISETGRGESTGGKPRMRLEINPASRLGIGAHIGQDYITYVVADLAGTVVGRKRVDGPGEASPVSVVARMSEDIESLIVGINLDRTSIVGMGLAIPGPVDRVAGTVRGVPALMGWTEFPIRKALATTTGLQVEFDNDATAAAIGEYWLGATVGYGSYASVYMGSGIGSGIVIDGTIYHGLSANVGEIGHVTVDARGPECPCGSFGCLELFAGPRAIMAKATDAVRRGDLDIPLTGKTSVDFATLGTAATRGDAAAVALVQESADYLASALVSMVNLFDLPLIVLAGNAFSTAGSIYVRTISRVLAERAMVRDIHPIEVRMSVNGNDAAALGAATLVLQDRLSPRSLRSVAFS